MTEAVIDRPVRALMVEDQDDLRVAIESSLSMFGIKVTGVGTAAAFRERIAGDAFDLAIVDLGLPDGDGLSLVRALTDDPTGPGVVILTASGEIEDRIKGFASGADLYFTKPVDCRELAVAAIRLAQRLRKWTAPPEISHALPSAPGRWTISRAQWALRSPGGGPVSLTPKEMAFMDALAAAANAAVPRAQILNLLGYADDAGGNRSLDALVRRLRMKTYGALAVTLPIRTLHGIGYMFTEALVAE